MKTRDHEKLAVFWMQQVGFDLPRRYQWAFIYGNLEPDVNVFTHFRGFWKQRKPHGHRSKIILPILMRMLQRDVGKPLTLLRSYRLGKCFHYAADIFTFSHNSDFEGDLTAHNQYEAEMHAHWMQVLEDYQPKLALAYHVGETSVCRTLLEMHQVYCRTKRNWEMDCRYILAVTKMMLERSMMACG